MDYIMPVVMTSLVFILCYKTYKNSETDTNNSKNVQHFAK